MGNVSYFQIPEKSRLSDEVARTIAQVIREGRYQPGQMLPSERELALQFKVSRPVLREALRILEIQGLISIQHGKGAVVKSSGTDILSIPIEEWFAENYSLITQFYEARLTVEPICAALAAERASDEEIAYLHKIMADEEKLTEEENVPTFVGLDIDLHTAVAHMSGNYFLAQMMDAMINPETDMRKIVLRLPDHLPVAHHGHFEIVNAIARHQPEEARQAMINALTVPMQNIEEFLSNQEQRNA